jgi:hypothetical protein
VNPGSDATLLRGGHPLALFRDGWNGHRTPPRFGAVSFHVQAGRCQPASFLLGREYTFHFHHQRGEPTRANTELSAVRHDFSWPSPSRGAGRQGSRTMHPSRRVPVSNPGRVHATSSRIGEGNATFLKPVAEIPSVVVFRRFRLPTHLFGALPPSGWWPGGTANSNRC